MVLIWLSVSDDAFGGGIMEVEKRPFRAVQQSMENFVLWLKSSEIAAALQLEQSIEFTGNTNIY
ncbi:MAG: hypothetical protein Q7U54_12445 [Bacteroidales bacterium]|nr:hypothetical protein [Bacteroidales bacterium]